MWDKEVERITFVLNVASIIAHTQIANGEGLSHNDYIPSPNEIVTLLLMTKLKAGVMIPVATLNRESRILWHNLVNQITWRAKTTIKSKY